MNSKSENNSLRKPAFTRKPLENRRINDSTEKPKKKGKIWKILVLVLLICGVAGGVWYYFFSQTAAASKIPAVRDINKTVKKVIIPDLKQDENGYTNFLLIGKDTREWSKGLQNTDTVMIGSYNNETGEIILVSVPRDMWVKYPINATYYRRVNGVYAYGEKLGAGQGIEMLKTVSKDLTGLDIHYWAMVDLAGFTKAIDIMGGVDIDVERAFTDYNFPRDGDGGYRTISFKEGLQHMDGKTALDYARSRKGNNHEGSDFARARRQQKVVQAFLAKFTAIENLNLEKLLELKETVDQSVKYSEIGVTDLQAALYQMKKVDSEKVTSIVLDPEVGDGKLIVRLSNTLTGGAYAIGPAKGLHKWEDVQVYLNKVIEEPALYREAATVYTYNGGLGYTQSNTETVNLKKKFSQFKVTFSGNNGADDVVEVVILVNQEKPETLKVLKDYFEKAGHKVEIVRTIEGFSPKHREDISIIFGGKAPEEAAETSGTTGGTTSQ